MSVTRKSRIQSKDEGNKSIMAKKNKPDSETRKWIRNRSDELAISKGCRFDASRGRFTCEWIERYCSIYEGSEAGKPLELLPWHRDVLMRIFSWVEYSEHWEREVRRFRRAAIWTPKKNGKTPLLAFVALYMMFGDLTNGAKGQHVFIAARDGGQADLPWKHITACVNSSEQILKEPTSINLSKRIVTHEPTLSTIEVIAGDNKKSQEGKNGSLVIDELHVVDRELMEILKYMGRNWPEPLQFSASTAGNNPDSYGKEMFEYGRAVNKAKDVKDIGYFHVDYGLPDDIKDSDLCANILKYGKMVNPAWGTKLIDPQTFKREFHEARRSKSAFSTFKMYCLNQWQRSSNPWLPAIAWEECGIEQEAINKSLDNVDVCAALDLSGVSDLVAWVECSNVDETYLFDVTLWLPEKYAEDHAATEHFKSWGDDKTIFLCPGEVIDFQMVSNYILDRKSRRHVVSVTYDPMMARTFAQDLQRGIVGKGGELLKEGLGCKLIEFPQTAPSWAKPSQDFERALMARKLRHPNNACLNWQAGHVEGKRDTYGNLRPIKPDNATKKIDGIVAMVMAFATASVKTQKPSISFI